MQWFSNARQDVTGGFVSALLAIPLTIGFGMFAFVSLGEGYFAHGAIAGIYTGFILCIVAVLLGDKTTTVYAPRINSTFFLGIFTFGLVHTDNQVIAAGGVPLVLAIVFAVIMLGGALQALFGLVRLGTLIKFVPHPVMAGFQNAAALLLFLVQLANVSGLDHHVSFMAMHKHLSEAKPLSLFIAIVTFLSMWNAKKFAPKIPPLFVGIGVGSAIYFAVYLAGHGGLLGPVIGSYPSAFMHHVRFTYFTDLWAAKHFLEFVPLIGGAALALAIIASIDALLCAKLATPAGEKTPDSNRLLMRLGAGNVASGFFGGITSGINIGASISNRAFGGKTPLSVLVHALTLIVAAILFWKTGAYLPQSVLSACIMVIAVQHLDAWSLKLPARMLSKVGSFRRTSALDLFVVLVVAALSVLVNIVLAVFIGIGVAILLFVVRMSRGIVRRSYRCNMVHSRKARAPEERDLLARDGRSILVMELQSALFFGSAETLAQEIETAMRIPTEDIILDLRRVTEIDTTGAQVLTGIAAGLERTGKHLLYAVTPNSKPAVRLRDFGVAKPETVFPDVDRAIEWAEDNLLRKELPPVKQGAEIPLKDIGLLAIFAPEEIRVLGQKFERRNYAAGKPVFSEGDPGDEVFLIAKGNASVFIKQPGGNIRLATFAPGTVFGELALLDEGTRSASVVADGELVCYGLTKNNFGALAKEAPAVAIKLISALGRELSSRLRAANRTIHQLES
jgi:MFS superfamily sulfate permease-like transporter